MSDTEPEPVEQHDEPPQEGLNIDAADADGTALHPADPSNPADVQAVSSEQPAHQNPDIGSAERQLSPVLGESIEVTSASVDAELQQSADEDHVETISDSGDVSTPQQQQDVTQQDMPNSSLAQLSASPVLYQQTADAEAGYAATAGESDIDPRVDHELRHSLAAEQAAYAEDEVPAAYAAALSNPELDPDHPLLARAQAALAKQLLGIKYRLESDVREKAVALQVPQSFYIVDDKHALKTAIVLLSFRPTISKPANSAGLACEILRNH